METDSDSQLLAQYRDGSRDAFDTLVRRYVDFVYSTSLRRVRDPHLAEDVTQAVFLVLARKSSSLSPQALLPGWLFKTARNLSADALKIQRRRTRHEKIAAMQKSNTIQLAEPSLEILVHLEQAMDALAPSDRNALLLRYYQSLRNDEVAARLGLTENTVAKRLSRALERLRSQLGLRGVHVPTVVVGSTLAAGVVFTAPSGVKAACLTPSPLFSPMVKALVRRSVIQPVVAGSMLALVTLAIIAVTLILPHRRHQQVAQLPAIQTAASQPDPVSDLEPATDEQDQQIRGAVWTLRHANAFARTTDWMSAVRTLVLIGRPAVPELVAELDRTSRNNTIQMIAFTLRAIDDPRACQALIRALPRCPEVSSSLGMDTPDKELSKFITEHSHGRATHPSLDTANGEVLNALEMITTHREGKLYSFSGQVTEARRNAVRQSQISLAKSWQAWWDAHHTDLVSDLDMATLTTQPNDLAKLESIGQAVNGQLFPTGHPYHLGDVQDVWLNDWQDRFDHDQVISFDRQQTLNLLDCTRLLPAGVRYTSTGSWYIDPPVAADVYCQTQLQRRTDLPTTRPTNHKSGLNAVASAIMNATPDQFDSFYALYPFGTAVWPVDNAMWDTLSATIDAGGPIPLDPVGPYSDFFSAHKPDQPSPHQYPATFLSGEPADGALSLQTDRSIRACNRRIVAAHCGRVRFSG